ncbi:DNA adenine methylase [Helicobacter turcicus]|uniref:site-specific DNA-methyltransferase (adenine-specific) n=1 Tax=Helicobacter turcicus TaxID=2867412 RepID=A0ABS7JLV6_9HELI|nr:DNA adenine methylase [Helicobacter turcicus]MBX7490379.1 DNA adenine methylase [Helicobacter turcicus]MBX7545042.1 DNA adenine methylase [Helicobacter turcicus]
MFSIYSRRYTGAKTKLLKEIDKVLLEHFDYTKQSNLSFFDVFAGTGAVSAFFMQKSQFNHFLLNDFLESNFIIYQGFFAQKRFSQSKLLGLQKYFQSLEPQTLKQNYYSQAFGGKFFSLNDSKYIGFVREELDKLVKQRKINTKEFHILLSSLLYSADRVANTCGHYDAYRKNVSLGDRFSFELILPLKTQAKIELFKTDSNALVKAFIKQKRKLDVAFIDPPYNSRQYSRFYHLLETLTQNHKPKLYGVALKPKPENLSEYCKSNAKNAFKDLIKSLALITKFLVVTYNNTYGANTRSNARINDEEIVQILKEYGKVCVYEFDYKAFSSGKSELKNHKERIFICQI